MSKSEFEKMVDAALASGCCYTPELAAEVDRLLMEDAPPLTVEQRQRFIAAAERGLAANREKANRERLTAVCRCSHQRIEHRHDRCGATVEWRPGMTTECPCRGFAEIETDE